MNRNATFTVSLATATLSSGLMAQAAPGPRGPLGTPSGNPTSPSVLGRIQASGTSSRGRVVVASEITVAIQILARADVRKDLALTADQLDALAGIATMASVEDASEDVVRDRIGRVLTTAQVTRLTELLIQYLGYRSLQFADIRGELELSGDQEAEIVDLINALSRSKAALRSVGSARAQAVSRLETQAAGRLAGVLTASQDKALRALAGRALGS